MFLVSGITGHVGGAAADKLLAEGHKVRALVRDPKKAERWAKRGVELREGDFGDPDALIGALDGVEAAFVMMPPMMSPQPGFPEATALAQSLRTGLAKKTPERVVVLSSIGSEKPNKLGLITATRILEGALSEIANVAFVRAGSFLENYAYGVPASAHTGTFDVFATPTSLSIPMVASEDIGREVARLLTNAWIGKKIVELGTLSSCDDLAAALSAVNERKVDARSIPRGQWEAALTGMGMPPSGAAQFAEMQDSINSRWIAFGVPGTEPVASTITPAQFFAQVKKG